MSSLAQRSLRRFWPAWSARRQPREANRQQAVRHAEIRRLALVLRESGRALKANRTQLQTIVNDLAPGLTDRRGVGPISAAQAIVSFPHPGRCRNDAAFAALSGTSPLEASSGRTVRHRLNRGGDRALNRAIHTIATTRMRSCPTTQAYVARRTAEGKTSREIRRCLIGEVSASRSGLDRGSSERWGTASLPSRVDGQFEFCRPRRAEVCRPALGTRP